MEEVLSYLQKYEIWIYLLLGSVAFFHLIRLVTAWKEWRSTLFGIEREFAQRRMSSAMAFIGLAVLIMLAQFILVSFVAPALPKTTLLPTPTLDILATATPTLAVTADVTPSVVPAEGLAPTMPPVTAEGCVVDQIEWSSPMMNEEVRGNVELKGTVNIPNLGFYKYEFSQPGSTTWATIAAGNEIKIDDTFGAMWNTSQLVPGDYFLRLVVTDNQNKVLPACVVAVRVLAP